MSYSLTPDRLARVRLWLFCLAVPTLYALAVTLLDIPVAGGAYETGKYSQISLDWLDNGLLPGNGEFLNTDRLPAYPAFLAVIFALFGRENYTMVLVAQTLLAAGTIYLTAQSAREIRQNWTWPAAILAALTLNISYRGTLALPDILLTFLVAGFMFSGLKALSSERVLGWLIIFGLAGAAAILTRPVFQFVFLLALPVYLVALAVHRGIDFRRAGLMVLIPVTLMAGAYAGQVMKVRALTGYATFTTQAGNHALFWLMPCLAQPYGCGQRSLEKIAEANVRLAENLAAAEPQERQNPVVIDRHKRALAVEMLLELPLAETAVSAAASMTKMMFHSGVYEINDRAGVKSVHFTRIPGSTLSQKIKGFTAAIFGSVPMLIWLLSQIAVLASRGIEIVGVFSGAADRELRWKILFLVAVAIALLAPAVGIGNPRYRAPAEPVLILLLLQGLQVVWSNMSRFISRRSTA